MMITARWFYRLTLHSGVLLVLFVLVWIWYRMIGHTLYHGNLTEVRNELRNHSHIVHEHETIARNVSHEYENNPSILPTMVTYEIDDALKVSLVKLANMFPELKNASRDTFQFNVPMSNSLDIFRNLTDVRHPKCLQTAYDLDELPKASVIIPFHNEIWSVVLRTINSVLFRSPATLLKEIILVDDASTHDFLLQPLDDYVAALPKTSIIRNPSRQGLIRTRMNGARVAQGDALVFLDAHVEVTAGWLEPLLEALRERPGIIASPVISNINPDTLTYHWYNTIWLGGFSWKLDYTWTSIPPHTKKNLTSHTEYIPTPTIVGCAFAVDRAVFFNLGTFDEGMDVWGGENLEISFRFWMCSQGAYVIPCSHVGHLYRQFLPYEVKDINVIQKNYQRVADIWLDDYAKYFYATQPKRYNFTSEETQSLRERRTLRDRLQCHNFDWYLRNVTPESFVPWSTASYQGQFKNLGSRLCVQVNSATGYVDMYACDLNKNQYFYIVSERYLYFNRTHCMVFSDSDAMLQAVPCQQDTHHEWDVSSTNPPTIQEKSKNLKHVVSLCRPGRDEAVHCITQLSVSSGTSAGAWKQDVNMDYAYWAFTYKL